MCFLKIKKMKQLPVLIYTVICISPRLNETEPQFHNKSERSIQRPSHHQMFNIMIGSWTHNLPCIFSQCRRPDSRIGMIFSRKWMYMFHQHPHYSNSLWTWTSRRIVSLIHLKFQENYNNEIQSYYNITKTFYMLKINYKLIKY